MEEHNIPAYLLALGGGIAGALLWGEVGALIGAYVPTFVLMLGHEDVRSAADEQEGQLMRGLTLAGMALLASAIPAIIGYFAGIFFANLVG